MNERCWPTGIAFENTYDCFMYVSRVVVVPAVRYIV